MITLCKCDRGRNDFAKSTDYSSTLYGGGGGEPHSCILKVVIQLQTLTDR
jgi:hypothetical protein